MGLTVTRIGAGVYRVDHDGRADIVFVAGSPDDRWAFWNGEVFRSRGDAPAARRSTHGDAPEPLTAPMPATVLQVLVQPGATVKKGDVVIVLEAMKMELPLRAPGDATVTAVNCREGELVQPDVVLVRF